MRIAAAAIVLASLGLNQAAAAPKPERGRVILSCELDGERKVTACQVTRQTPGDIGLGEIASQWAIGKTIPAPAGGVETFPALVDLPLCFDITRSPLQATMDMVGKCDAMTTDRVGYGHYNIISKPPGAEVFNAKSMVAWVVPGEGGRAPRVVLDESKGIPPGAVQRASPTAPGEALMRCSVMTSGALSCTALTMPKNPELEAAALRAAREIRVRVRQTGGPAPGSIAFTLKP